MQWIAMVSLGSGVGDQSVAARLLASADQSPTTPAIAAYETAVHTLAVEAGPDVRPAPFESDSAAVEAAYELVMARSSVPQPEAMADGNAVPAPAPTMRFGGARWTLTWNGEMADLPAMKGLGDLARMLPNPGREYHSLELMGSPLVESSTGPALDAAARRAYEERLRELQGEIDSAEQTNDVGRQARFQEEFDRIVDELSAGLGLGGRDREKGSAPEKARQAVTWRIRAAVRKIEAAIPACGRHLQRSVRTGGILRL